MKAILWRQQGMPPERDDDRLIIRRQHRGFRILRPGGQIGHRGPLAPLGHGLLVRRENVPPDRFRTLVTAIARRKRPQALCTVLYCSTDCLSRRGQSPGFSSTG